MRAVGHVGWALILPALLIVTWWVTSANSTNYIFPPLSQITEAFAANWLSAEGAAQALPSIRNFLIGYLAACLIGLLVGSLLGTHTRAREAAMPAMDYLRSLPPPVLLPLGVLVLGTGGDMKIAVIAAGSIWPVIFSTMEGVRGTESVRVAMSSVFKLRARERWRFVILPGASPHIVAGMHSALQIAFVLIVISEFIASTSGIGFSILQASRTFRQADMWAGVIFLGILGLVLNLVFGAVKRWVLRWQIEEARTKQFQ